MVSEAGIFTTTGVDCTFIIMYYVHMHCNYDYETLGHNQSDHLIVGGIWLYIYMHSALGGRGYVPRGIMHVYIHTCLNDVLHTYNLHMIGFIYTYMYIIC